MKRWLTTALPRPDFLRPASPQAGLAWLACASAMLVLSVAVWDAWDAWDARTAWQPPPGDENPPPHKQDPASGANRTPPGTRPAGAAGLAAGAAAPDSQRWLQRLARPWPAIWAASETASQGGIVWQSMDLQDDGQLRLQGLANEAGAALSAGHSLRQQVQAGRKVWREVVVTRIDRQASGQRFELQARLNDPAAPAATAAPAPP